MMKSFLIVMIAVCGMAALKNRLLGDGITKVPKDAAFFDKQYRGKYNVNLPEGADTTALYVERYYVGFRGELFEKGKEREGELLGVYRFYPNGCVNSFSIANNELDRMPSLDPEVRGYRGVSFVKKGERVLDMAVPVNGLGHLGVRSLEIEINGDTLIVADSRARSKNIYLRVKNKQLQSGYRADW